MKELTPYWLMPLKYLPSLLLTPKVGVLKLSREDYLISVISSFFITGIIWGIIFAIYFQEDILNNNVLLIFSKSITSWILPPLIVVAVYYLFNFLFKGKTNFKNILQIVVCIGIVKSVFFLPLYFLLFVVLPFSETITWFGKAIGIVQIIWEFFVLKYYGELIADFSKKNAIMASIITLIMFWVTEFAIMWFRGDTL